VTLLILAPIIALVCFCAGFLFAAMVAAGAREDRHAEFLLWCESRCGRQCDSEYEWRDGNDG
jgi:hypothetical protein